MKIVKCKQCAYWDYNKIESAPVGVCRYNAPAPRVGYCGEDDELSTSDTVWPVTGSADWCRHGLQCD